MQTPPQQLTRHTEHTGTPLSLPRPSPSPPPCPSTRCCYLFGHGVDEPHVEVLLCPKSCKEAKRGQEAEGLGSEKERREGQLSGEGSVGKEVLCCITASSLPRGAGKKRTH